MKSSRREEAAAACVSSSLWPASKTWDSILGSVRIRGLDTLPVAQQDAFLLCSVEGLSSREAAALAGSPEQTLRTRLFHARRKLRAFLEREGFAAPLRPGKKRRVVAGPPETDPTCDFRAASSSGSP